MSCTEPSFLTSSLTQRFYKTEERVKDTGLAKRHRASHRACPPSRSRSFLPRSSKAQGPVPPAPLAHLAPPRLRSPAESPGRRAECPCQRGSSAPRARTGPAASAFDCSSKSARGSGVRGSGKTVSPKRSRHSKEGWGLRGRGNGQGTRDKDLRKATAPGQTSASPQARVMLGPCSCPSGRLGHLRKGSFPSVVAPDTGRTPRVRGVGGSGAGGSPCTSQGLGGEAGGG